MMLGLFDMFIIDLETLSVDSTGVVLSIGCTHVTDKTDDYQKILDNSIMLKLDIAEQLDKGRTVDDGTMKWWDRQADIVKEASLVPNKSKDLRVLEALKMLKIWLTEEGFGKDSMFARGALDSMALDSLARSFDISCPVPYNRFYDVRTAVDLMYPEARYGYVDVDHPTFKTSMVIKHHPVHDCAYDGMMLQYGKKCE